jgi:type I restriction enzyme, S subunit
MTWKLVKLGTVCDLKNGFAFKSNLFKQKGHPILRISNIQNERIDTRRPVYFDVKDYKIDFRKYEVNNGDLLIAMSGATTGKIGFNESQTTFYLNQRVGKLVPGKDLDKKYLYYLLSTKVEENLKISKGAAQPNLSSEQIKNIEFSLPSIPEQQHIVAKLDTAFVEIDKIINLTAEIIVKEEDLNLSALKSIFSTIKSKKTIGEIATVIAGQSPEGKYYNRNAKGTPFYQGKKEFGDYELKKPTFWTTKTTKEALKGDVLLSVRAPVGETNMNNDKICIGRGLAAIRANKDNNSEFIYYFLNSIKKLIVGNTGAVFNSINKKQIEDIVIPIQSLDEQNKTINKIKLILSHIKKINLYTKQKLHNLNILKSTILNCELKNRTL